MLSPETKAATTVIKVRPLSRLPELEALKAMTNSEVELLERRLLEPVECVFDPTFEDPRAIEHFLPLRWGELTPGRSQKANDDSGVDLLAVESSGFTAEDERRMFLRFNFCRYRALRILQQFKGKALTNDAACELVRWEAAIQEGRGEIVRVNVPLVLAMAKRTRITGVDFADLISEGNLALLRAVDKFDCARGFKFSTYACRAILKSFSRVAVRSARHRGHFPTEFDPTLERSDFVERRRDIVERECVEDLKSILMNNLANLNDVEEVVIRARFALDEPSPEAVELRGKTLEQVGEMIGVTKERVRQIQNKALSKLKLALEEGTLSET
ncbi:MAG: sigma-70 family RNA polymerase sigma factor [Phycisphaerales bacterium]|nr:sigma-70 family RNA polymerase sigma factor [Phycisphaerales bacterium]